MMYFQNEDYYWQEYGESMHATQVVPYCVVLLIGHPWPGHKDEEQDVHDEEHND